MSLSTLSVAARHVPGLWDKDCDDGSFHPQRGDIEILDTEPPALAMCCPGCGTVTLLPLAPGHGPAWQYDGNRDKPTLHPSIHHLNCWHGWLRAGLFVSC